MCEHCGCRRFPEIEALGTEHDQIQDIADRVLHSEQEQRGEILAALRASIEPHVVREESGVFEEARAYGIARDYWVDDLEEDHRRFAHLLDDPSQLTTEELEKFLDDLHRHISVEEYDLFPAIAREWEKDGDDTARVAS
jgi:hemerythrin-like domain-containing protein